CPAGRMGKHGSVRVIALATTQVCPLMAQSGHPYLHRTCPLSGVKRTCRLALQTSVFDPKRTSSRGAEIEICIGLGIVVSLRRRRYASTRWTRAAGDRSAQGAQTFDRTRID